MAGKAEPSSRKRRLKVFRTAIGFHDAYVAAPSRKAALEAWGTDKDLFARGVARLLDVLEPWAAQQDPDADDVRKRLQILRLAPIPVPGSVPYELLTTDLRGLFEDPEAWIVAHPEALEDIVGGSSGLLASVLGNFGLMADVEYMSVLLSATY